MTGQPTVQVPSGEGTPPAQEPVPNAAGTFERGTRVGPYVVGERLGAGGMGEVYAAYDPRLDRRIALKVLRLDFLVTLGLEEGRLRLLREAQALARLNHRNVVAIHDVASVGKVLYLAMELVEGITLRQWLSLRPRHWREVVATFVEAGRGLAAAHAAGLVHRDFKPSNVLVARDGRVVVVDFGLAAATGTRSQAGTAASQGDSLLSHDLTRAGAVLGTLAYMAPEQMDAGQVDAYTDQFSFCVALHEALNGKRPFSGSDIPALRVAIAAGAAQGTARYPASVRRAIARGLSESPHRRFPSMGELLAILETALAGVRRRRVALASAAAVALVAAGAVGWSAWRSRVCTGAREAMASAWGPELARGIREAFQAQGGAEASKQADEAVAFVDRWAQRWVQLRTGACEATRVRGERSEEMLSRELACFDRQLHSVRALAEAYRQPTPDVVTNAIRAASNLPSLEECTDARALGGAVELPENARGEADEIQRLIARVRVLFDTGSPATAKLAAREAVRRADALGQAPVQARARYELGWLLTNMNDHGAAAPELREAVGLSAVAMDDELFARATNQLLLVTWGRLRNAVDGRWQAELARGAVERLGRPSGPEGELEKTLALITYNEGHRDEARAHFERAQALLEQAYGPMDPTVGHLFSYWGLMSRDEGDLAGARAKFTRALEIRRRAFGPRHPDLIVVEGNLALILKDEGRLEDAYAAYQAVLERQRAATGEGPRLTTPLFNLCELASRLGRHDEAVAFCERAVRIQEKVDPDGDMAWAARFNLGDALLARGDALRALETMRQARERLEDTSSPDEKAELLAGVGRALVALRRHREALEVLDRAAALAPAKGSWLAMGRMHAARAAALHALGREAEASTAAQQARERLAHLGPGATAELRALEESLRPQ